MTAPGLAHTGAGSGLAHGSAGAAMRGCWCGQCRRRLAELAGERPAQLELPFPAAPAGALPGPGPVPLGSCVGVRLLPAGLVPVLPAGMDAMAASQARQEVLAGACGGEAVRRLVRLGLAAPAPAGVAR